MPESQTTIVDLFPSAPAAPTSDQVDAIVSLISSTLQERGDVPPLTTLLSPDQLEQLVALHWHNPLYAQRLQDILLGLVTSQSDRAALSLRSFAQEAGRRRRDMREQESAERARARLQQRQLREEERTRTQGARVVVDPPSRELTADEMIASKSPWLMGLGWLRKLRTGRMWFDTFYHRSFLDWGGSFDTTPIEPRMRTDEDNRRIYTWLVEQEDTLANLSWQTATNLFDAFSETDKRNEPQDWLRALEWDRIPRLEHLLPTAYSTPDDPYHNALGVSWFMSMAQRVLVPGSKVDHMLVFIGPQEYGKSKSLEVIGGKWYGTSTSNIGDKDWFAELQGKICVELPELHQIISTRADANRIKAALSIAVDHYRPPYGRLVQAYQRTAMLVGTTNERGWHTDTTGGRRFWPAHVPHPVDCDYLHDARDQLFAEAAFYLSQGRRWWEVPTDDQRAAIEAEREVTPSEERIVTFLGSERLYDGVGSVPFVAPERRAIDDSTRWGTLVTMDRIMTQCLALAPDRHDQSIRKVSRIMRMLGWRVDRAWVEGVALRYWVREEAERRTASDIAAERSTRPPEEDSSEIPF